MRTVWLLTLTAATALGAATGAAAGTFPFAEDFVSNAANWKFNSSTQLTYVPSGGPDGSGYVSRTMAFTSPTAMSQTLFRAQSDFNSSGLLYAGNWLNAGVYEVAAYVRHNAPQALNFRSRFASPFNFPGASAIIPTAVPPNVWTPITFEIDPASAQYHQLGPDPTNDQFEGSSFNEIFADIGNIQIGVGIPESLRGGATPFTFDLDQVRVNAVPEPASGLLAAIGGWAAVALARRRGR
jgi:hypothetical protein